MKSSNRPILTSTIPGDADDRMDKRQDGSDVPSETGGYSPLSIVSHWSAAILIAVLFLTHEGAPGSLAHFLHVSGGALAGLFLLWRVWHRVSRGVPPLPDQAFILNVLARSVQWGLLITIVIVVISGYLLPWTQGRPLEAFGLAIPSPMAANRDFHQLVETAHDVAGHLFVPLLILHILGTVKHAVVDRDGIARRMFRPVGNGR